MDGDAAWRRPWGWWYKGTDPGGMTRRRLLSGLEGAVPWLKEGRLECGLASSAAVDLKPALGGGCRGVSCWPGREVGGPEELEVGRDGA